MSSFDLSISFSKFQTIHLGRWYKYCCAVVDTRCIAQSKFSPVYSLLITMYRRTEVRRGGLSRESYEVVFSSLGAFVLRGQERTVQARLSSSPIPRLNFVPLCTAARLKTTPRERSSAIVSMDSYRAPSSRTSTSFLPLLLLPVFLFAIHSQIYPHGALFFRLIIKFPFWRTSFAVPLFGYPYRLLLTLALSHFDPSYVFVWFPIHRICIRIYERDRPRSRLLLSFLPVSTYHSSRLLFLFLPPAPLPRLSIYESGRYGVAPRLFASGDL